MGNLSILNNIAAIHGQNELTKTSVLLNQTLNRLSSGRRINSGADDAAGMMIADTLRANVRAIDQAVRNANDAISVSQIADGALGEITNLLTRSVSLAEQAATGTVDNTARGALNAEFTQIKAEIARIATQTNFGGVMLFSDDPDLSILNGELNVFVGDIFSDSSITITINTIEVTQNGAGEASVILGQNGSEVDLTDSSLATATDALAALGLIKDALIQIAMDRGTIGAGMNRLQSAAAVLQSQSLNTQAAESTIRDANIATEVSNLTKYQILSQTGMAALSQANAQSQSILSLMRGLG
ncbi:MAG TPA: flagellin [Acidobacteriota bacterium]|nr:flagellin [Acidobacteriota bacterium]